MNIAVEVGIQLEIADKGSEEKGKDKDMMVNNH